jgi:hypothetical protein
MKANGHAESAERVAERTVFLSEHLGNLMRHHAETADARRARNQSPRETPVCHEKCVELLGILRDLLGNCDIRLSADVLPDTQKLVQDLAEGLTQHNSHHSSLQMRAVLLQHATSLLSLAAPQSPKHLLLHPRGRTFLDQLRKDIEVSEENVLEHDAIASWQCREALGAYERATANGMHVDTHRHIVRSLMTDAVEG